MSFQDWNYKVSLGCQLDSRGETKSSLLYRGLVGEWWLIHIVAEMTIQLWSFDESPLVMANESMIMNQL